MRASGHRPARPSDSPRPDDSPSGCARPHRGSDAGLRRTAAVRGRRVLLARRALVGSAPADRYPSFHPRESLKAEELPARIWQRAGADHPRRTTFRPGGKASRVSRIAPAQGLEPRSARPPTFRAEAWDSKPGSESLRSRRAPTYRDLARICGQTRGSTRERGLCPG